MRHIVTTAVLLGSLLPAMGAATAAESRPATGMVVDQQYVKAEAAYIANNATFGYSGAIDGDTMVVGALNENSGAASSGAAYVYTKQGGTWQLQARLTPPNPQTNAYFGIAVGVSGDTIVVAASEEDGSSTSTLDSLNQDADQAGAAYVYVRSGATWTLQAYLKASNASTQDKFGEQLAIDGDTIVVTTQWEDGSRTSTVDAPNDDAAEAGAAYVFVRNGTTWTQQAYLKAANADAGDYFGTAVDVDGDTLIVGAYGEAGNGSSPDDNSLTSSGAAYVFTRTDGVWTQQAYLKPLDQDQFDNFGVSASLDGDQVAVGANYEQGDSSSTVDAPNNNFGGGAGAAYVFARSGVSWTQQAYVKASNAGEEDEFGYKVALQGTRLVVGAGFEDGSASSTAASPNDAADAAGAVYVFDRVGDAWQQNAYLKPSNIGAYDAFGNAAVALDGDDLLATSSAEDGDASSTLASSNENAPGSGAAYVFSLRSAALSDLSFSFGDLTPAFDPLITQYTTTVPMSVTSITISPTVAHAGATFSVATAAGPCPSNTCALIQGENVITVTVTFDIAGRPAAVTAPTGASVREYVIVASRFASTNAALSALALSAGALTPSFAPATTNYTATVPNAASSVTVTPTTEDTTASAVVSTAAGACPANVCPLAVGANTITVTVTAQDAVTTRDYVVVVTRAQATNAALSALALSVGTLTPSFAPATTSYAATVPNATASVTVTLTADDANAAVAVSTAAGACPANVCPLAVGANTITVTVTAQDAVTTRSYVVVVTRAQATNAALSALALSAGALTPSFAPATTSYAATVPNAASSVTVTPTADDANADVAVSTAAGACPANVCPLAVGVNTITVTVTAPDGVTTRDYVLTITREAEQPSEWRIYAPIVVKRP